MLRVGFLERSNSENRGKIIKQVKEKYFLVAEDRHMR